MPILQPDRHLQLHTDFSLIFRSAYTSTPLWSDEISTTVPSNSSQNDYGWMGRILRMRRWDGPRVINSLRGYNYSIVNEPFELTVGVPRDDIDDDNLGVYGPMFEELGRQSRKFKDQQLKTLLQAGTTGIGFDGVAFFATTHPLNPAGTQSNLFAGTALTAANFNTVLATMQTHTGEDGEVLGAFQSQPVLVVPPQLANTARGIVNAGLVDGTVGGGNTNTLQGMARIMVVPELSNEPTVWYLMDLSNAIKPLVWQVRRENAMVSRDQVTDDGVWYNGELQWGVDGRYGQGYSLWWLAARCAA